MSNQVLIFVTSSFYNYQKAEINDYPKIGFKKQLKILFEKGISSLCHMSNTNRFLGLSVCIYACMYVFMYICRMYA